MPPIGPGLRSVRHEPHSIKHPGCSRDDSARYVLLSVVVVLVAEFIEVVSMFKIMAWLGIYVGTPSVATYLTLSFQDHFIVFFAFFVGVVLLAILPLLGNTARR